MVAGGPGEGAQEGEGAVGVVVDGQRLNFRLWAAEMRLSLVGVPWRWAADRRSSRSGKWREVKWMDGPSYRSGLTRRVVRPVWTIRVMVAPPARALRSGVIGSFTQVRVPREVARERAFRTMSAAAGVFWRLMGVVRF